MGATNTNSLADYLVSIRTKKQPKQQFHKNHKQGETFKQTRVKRPDDDDNNKRNNHSTIDTTKTKRIKTAKKEETVMTLASKNSSTKAKIQTPQYSAACTLQPHFTKDASLRLVQGKNLEQEQKSQCKEHVQYQLEIPSGLLDDFSMEAHPSNSNASDSSCSISQITQDSSLDEEDYAYSSEEEEKDCHDDNNDDDGHDDDQEMQSRDGSGCNHHILEPSRQYSPDAKLPEVKEGARMLLDLLSMP
ncbi:unnamed protein product [Cylindrotheca closterium]|uniref:Uncharacterized protein n=1 Tax=Cylindrotheca closterium TaxID=2856 RepID=A0AAD2CKG5_9STRA|nr:unnamed protein product [Cylindrotheca closterium]